MEVKVLLLDRKRRRRASERDDLPLFSAVTLVPKLVHSSVLDVVVKIGTKEF